MTKVKTKKKLNKRGIIILSSAILLLGAFLLGMRSINNNINKSCPDCTTQCYSYNGLLLKSTIEKHCDCNEVIPLFSTE